MRFISDRPDASLGGEIVRLALQAAAVHLDQMVDGPAPFPGNDQAGATDPLGGVSREERTALWDGEVKP